RRRITKAFRRAAQGPERWCKGVGLMRFFKYTTAEGAKKILATKELKWTCPGLLNDPFDLQFDLHVDDFDQTRIAALVLEELWSLYSGRKALNPGNELGRVFALFLSKRIGLSRADIFDTEELYDAIVEGTSRMKALVPKMHEFQRSFLKDAKLLCLSAVH